MNVWMKSGIIEGNKNMPPTMLKHPGGVTNSTMEVLPMNQSYPQSSELKNPIRIDELEQQFATSGVYVIYCTETDTYYIGESQVVIKRILNHFDELKSNIHGNNILQKEYSKFGRDVFVVDLLHDMPNSSRVERLRQEYKEIVRFRTYHRRLYNKVAHQVRVTQPMPAKKRATRKVNSEPFEITDAMRKQPSVITEPIPFETAGTCRDCGITGMMYEYLFDCDDGKVRCSACIEKRLDKWRINFNREDQEVINLRNGDLCFRWATNDRQHIKEQLASAFSRFIEKHESYPPAVYVNSKYVGPGEFEDVKIRIRKHTPRGCIDIPIPQTR